MAEGPDKTAEDLEQEITCPVCCDHFDDPRILPCSHYYCKKCVQALADRARPNQPFHCPECRAETLLPQNDPNRLPKALSVNRMKDFHAKLVDERKPLHKMCSKHNDPLKLFCFDCNRLICGQCAAFDHKTHTYEFVSKATPQHRELLVKQMMTLKATRKRYSDATDRAKAMKAEIEAQNTDNTRAINQWVERYVEIIQICGCNLVEKISSLSKQKVENLNAQIKSFVSASVEVQSLEQFCKENLENSADEEFIELHKQILSQVEDECRKHKDANLELAEEADIGVQLPSNQSLNDLCHNEAKVVVYADLASFPQSFGRGNEANADPASCTVNLESAEVNKSSRLTVCTLYRNGTPCKKPQAVEGELNSLVDGSLIVIKRTQLDGTYKMVYTPRIRGRHQLAVTVNGEQVAGSPFAMCVKIPPKQLGKSVRVISGLSSPYAVAFNSAGEVLVTMNGGIRVFNKHGKKVLRTIDHTFQEPRGIAVDKEDNVFVADHCRDPSRPYDYFVCKLGKDGNLLKTIGGVRSNGKAEFDYPTGVAVIGEQVFVCDSNNHRIQVFTRELEFVKVIGSRGTGNGQFKKVCDVSHDEAGNLYVCDYKNHRIQVLNSEGEFLHSFGTYGKGDGQLDQPSSVCVSEEFVYVSEYGIARVSVFDKNGVFVTSFKADGGWFSGHSMIRVDKDGFVYFCDQAYNRVQIF